MLAGFDVAVYDAGGVRVPECERGGFEDVERPVERQLPLLVDDGVEGFAADEFGGEVGDDLPGHQNGVGEVAVVDEARDSGMVKGGDRVGFSTEAGLGDEVFCDVIAEDFERDELLGVEVFGFPYPARSTDPDQSFEPEAVSDGHAGHQCHRGASFRPECNGDRPSQGLRGERFNGTGAEK